MHVTQDGAHSVPVRRHLQHSIDVQRSLMLIDITWYAVGCNALNKVFPSTRQAVTVLLREYHTLNKAGTALFTSKAASLNNATIVLWHTTALLRDPSFTLHHTPMKFPSPCLAFRQAITMHLAVVYV